MKYLSNKIVNNKIFLQIRIKMNLRFLAGNLWGVAVKFFKKQIFLAKVIFQNVKPVHVLYKIEQIFEQSLFYYNSQYYS